MNDVELTSHSESSLPPISIVMGLRNEERYLEQCLESLTTQDYPHDLIEIILIDGMSTDRSPEIIKAWAERDSRIRFFTNPARIVSVGMNLGIREAKYDLILWPSGHALLEPSHLKQSVATMRETDAAAVGGYLRTVGRGPIGRANAAILSSRFGVGGGAHRVGGKSGWVPTVTMALYKKSAILAAGGFDESLSRNQDVELHAQMNKRGLRSYLNVDIRPTYLCRDSVGGLLKQAWKNGYWNIASTRQGAGGFSLRHFVPMAFVFVLLLLAVLSIFLSEPRYALLGIAKLYGLVAVIASIVAAIQHKLTWQVLLLPFGFLALHLSYGTASWLALLRAGRSESHSG